MDRRRPALIAVIVLLWLLVACDEWDDGPTPRGGSVTNVTIDQFDQTLPVGRSTALTVTVTTVGAAGRGVTWTSSNASAATVTTEGIVTAQAPGTASITATSTFDSAKSDGVTIEVIPREVDANVLWTKQFGTTEDDLVTAIAIGPSRTIYVTGMANRRGFVRKYDAAGNLLWTDEITLGNFARVNAVAVDASGNAVVGGYTSDSSGIGSAFVRRYGPNGARLAAPPSFFGGPRASARAVALDETGNYYVVGYTGAALGGSTHAGDLDAYVRKYSAANTVLWTRQFGYASEDSAHAVTVDSAGHVIVVGHRTVFGSLDAFVRKYDANGVELWTRDLSTAGPDFGWSVSVDSSRNILVAGSTSGDLGGGHAGGADAYVRKYSADGTMLWTRQFGTARNDVANAVATDASGAVYVAGAQNGVVYIPGVQNGESEGFVRKYTAAGNEIWTHRLSTGLTTAVVGLSVDSIGNIVIGGLTTGNLEGAGRGKEDAFVRSYRP